MDDLPAGDRTDRQTPLYSDFDSDGNAVLAYQENVVGAPLHSFFRPRRSRSASG